ncbi:MAG: formylglycine-generating enzyme family protein [Rhizomicrobium sp.]
MTRRDWIAAAAIAAVAATGVAVPLLAGNAGGVCRSSSVVVAEGGMAWIPGGAFRQGDTVYPEEGPITPARVKGFWMDRHEVTNGEFAAFVAATGYVTQAERPLDPRSHAGIDADLLRPGAMVFFVPQELHGMEDISQWWHFVPDANWRHPAGPGSTIAGRGAYPVVAVTRADALAYARWKHRDLPTEAEWEWAARAGNPDPGNDHDQPRDANTWQGVFPVLNSGDDGFVGLAPVGCYGANRYGLYDMFGNVWELTNDLYRPRHGEAPTEVPERSGAARYVIKGGSFLCAPNYCMRYRSGAREGQEADLATSHLGFRTVSRAPQP